MKEMRGGCNKCGGPHPSLDCDDKPMGGPKEEEENYSFGGYRGNYYGFMITNPQDPRVHSLAIPKPIQNLQHQTINLTDHHLIQNEHVNAVFTRSGKTYDPPVNPNAKPAIFLNDSEDEADEVMKEAEPLPKKPTHADPPPLKAYKPNNSYSQCLHKENIEAQYAKFLEMMKEVRINVPLVDVLDGMPNYGKLLKDLVSNKSKMKQISAAFLTEECLAILQNKLPPKLGDPKVLRSLANSQTQINLKPTRMSIRLANHTYQYPMGVAENMLLQVGKFLFPVGFVILQIEEDEKVPLILGRPFLHTADAIIIVENKELNLVTREDRATFLIDKAMQHSHLNDDTCFRMDVIDEVTKDELDALLDDSKPFLSTSEKISETLLDKEFKEFMTRNVQEDEVKDDLKELPPKDELRIKTSIQDLPTDIEMKPLSKHLEYAFLEENSLLPDDVKPVSQRQRRLNPNMKKVVKKEIIKILDAGIIYAIEDNPWVSPVHCIPKKEGMTVVKNEDNELVPTRTVTGWRVCIEYRAENVTADHLSRLEKPNLKELREEEINDEFPNEFLMSISTDEKKVREAEALPTNDARVVINILKNLFSRFGIPKALISDRGTNFCNRQMEKILKKYGVHHRIATTYHPQTSGQLHELDELRLQAYENSKLYKARTKAFHKKKLRVRKEFKARDKVLLYNSKYKFKAPKLISKWYGPFIVKHGYPFGYVELYDKHGGSFIVNGHCVKLYHDEEQLNELTTKEIHLMCEEGILKAIPFMSSFLANYRETMPWELEKPYIYSVVENTCNEAKLYDLDETGKGIVIENILYVPSKGISLKKKWKGTTESG
nr:DNA-directed DNA polymerase [Tanacetum cinerariifolium]